MSDKFQQKYRIPSARASWWDYSLGAIRGFKSAVSRSARLINADFGWQSRYHDRIIRDQPEHERIVSYILNNPENWLQDGLFIDC